MSRPPGMAYRQGRKGYARVGRTGHGVYRWPILRADCKTMMAVALEREHMAPSASAGQIRGNRRRGSLRHPPRRRNRTQTQPLASHQFQCLVSATSKRKFSSRQQSICQKNRRKRRKSTVLPWMRWLLIKMRPTYSQGLNYQRKNCERPKRRRRLAICRRLHAICTRIYARI